MNKLKLIINILKKVSDGDIPVASDYNLNKKEFINLLEFMQYDNLIKGLEILKCEKEDKIITFKNNIEITTEGMNYLKEVSAFIKTCNWL